MAQFEIKKMKQGMSYSCKEKTIIMNVFKYFRTESPDLCVTEIVRRTSKATGCSEKSIFQFRKEEASGQGFKVPSTTKIRRNININSRDIKYDANVRQRIKNVIYDLKYKNITPSLNTIVKTVNSDPQLPNFSLMTLRRLLFDMGFCYEKQGNKAVLIEKPAVNKDPKSEKHMKKNVKPTSRNSQVIKDPNTGPHLPTNNIPVLANKNPVLPTHSIDNTNHRILPMHMPHPPDNTHVMPTHHNMIFNRMQMNQPMAPVMSNLNLNHQPLSNISHAGVNVRPEMAWMQGHGHHALMKQE